MNPKLLVAGIAVAAMTAAAAQAASTHRQSAGAYAEPAQPIAYANLKAYMKASPSQRRTRDWSGGTAASASNAGSNVSATTPSNAGSMPLSTQTQAPDANVSDTPPTVSPQVNTAPAQPPLNQAPPSNAQPPASNAPATTDQPGGPAPQ
ncbi:hypothetical protein [Phenylobacterium sp.]|jgi:hypothetical protein|uniref:hypothetical protein n=1 Tax=Phenylobacterium sp. TaxID=1871053 RepID=UPI002F403A0E